MILGDLKTFPNESAIEFTDKYLQKSMVISGLEFIDVYFD